MIAECCPQVRARLANVSSASQRAFSRPAPALAQRLAAAKTSIAFVSLGEMDCPQRALDILAIGPLISPLMTHSSAPRISKIPFLFGDLVLIAAAAWIAIYGRPLGGWQYVAIIAAVGLGAWLAAWPFVLEFRALMRVVETSELSSVTAKIKDLDKVSSSISSAIVEWQHMQQGATQTVTAVEHIAERMTTEARNFGELLTRMNESEKSHLRLEVEKLRRAEGDWLGVLVRILDHVHALHQAGVRSGQRNVVDQLSHFQNACRDTARRLGLVPVLPEPGIPFDATAHQVLDESKPADGAVVSDVVAPGYTFQGQVIRLPVVALKEPAAAAPEAIEGQLSFDQAAS
jgi:molecular chaperone GrpE (heat shock protein)